MRATIKRSGLVVVGGKKVPAIPRVQGIASSIDDVTLFGRGFRETVTERVLEFPMVERTTEGTSAITVPIHDPDGELRRSALFEGRVDVNLDGLGFTLSRIERQGDILSLKFRDREVVKLARRKGPKKAKNNKVTAPQFARLLAKEAGVPFYCPELHAPIPIRTSRAARENEAGRRVRREPGFGPRARITVKHAAASADQVRVIERVLDTCMSLKAHRKVMIAAVMCITQEAEARNLGGDGAFQQNASWPGDPRDVANATRNFLVRAPTYPGGAIAYLKRNPGTALGPMIQEIQRSAFPGAYSQWQEESTRTVDTYLGGASAATSSAQTAEPKRQKPHARGPKENSWRCQGRLAEELDWRRYMSAGVEYFLSETAMLASMPRVEIDDGAPGIEDIDWTQEDGLPVTEVSIQAYAKSWQAPPGTVADVVGQGVADGRYIVESITTDLVKRNSLADIKLKTPAEPNPEPVETGTRTRRVPSRDTGGDKVDRMIAEADRIDKLHLRYVWGGSHVAGKTPPNGPFDCSSAVSHLLQHVGLLSTTLVSGALASWGRSGPGREVTIYANDSHVFIKLRGRFWGTSRENPSGGPGWHSSRSASGFALRHPEGL